MSVSGLPSGVTGSVKVTMGSFAQTVTSTTTLSGLVPGTYTLTPQSVTLRRNVFNGTASGGSVTVSANATAHDSVSYAVQRGDLWTPDSQTGSVYMFSAGTLESSPTPAATISTGLSEPTDLAFDASGNLWVPNFGSGANSVVEYLAGSLTSNPSPAATITSGLSTPTGVAFDASGNLWVASNGNSTVVEYAAGSLNSSPTPAATISTGLSGPWALAFDATGNLWVLNYGSSSVKEYTAGTLTANPSPAATISTGLSSPQHLAFDAAGNLWVGNQGNSTVVRYAAGSLTSNPSPAATITTSAQYPVGVALDVFGNLWVAHQIAVKGIEEYAAAAIAAGGSLTPKATIGGRTNVQQTAFDPPPYDLPLSH